MSENCGGLDNAFLDIELFSYIMRGFLNAGILTHGENLI